MSGRLLQWAIRNQYAHNILLFRPVSAEASSTQEVGLHSYSAFLIRLPLGESKEIPLGESKEISWRHVCCAALLRMFLEAVLWQLLKVLWGRDVCSLFTVCVCLVFLFLFFARIHSGTRLTANQICKTLQAVALCSLVLRTCRHRQGSADIVKRHAHTAFVRHMWETTVQQQLFIVNINWWSLHHQQRKLSKLDHAYYASTPVISLQPSKGLTKLAQDLLDGSSVWRIFGCIEWLLWSICCLCSLPVWRWSRAVCKAMLARAECNIMIIIVSLQSTEANDHWQGLCCLLRGSLSVVCIRPMVLVRCCRLLMSHCVSSGM